MRRLRGISGCALSVGLMVILTGGLTVMAADSHPDAMEIARRLEQTITNREHDLTHYVSYRTYTVTNDRFNFESAMKIRMIFKLPNDKEIDVLQKSGSGILYKMVFKRILAGEMKQAKANFRKLTAMTPFNYRFKLDGQETLDGEPCWRLSVTPKRRSQYHLVGTIWVSQRDYDLVKVDGHPAKMPSFWTRDIHLVRKYKKVGEYWLPESDHTVNRVLIFGTSNLDIQYTGYSFDRVGFQKMEEKDNTVKQGEAPDNPRDK